MTKKGAIILITVTLLLVAGGLSGYYYFFMQPAAPTTETEGGISPFGPSPLNNNTNQTGSGEAPTTTTHELGGQNTYVAKLRQISDEQVAGAVIFDRTIQVGTSSKDKITKTFIRFVDRGTGHISEIATDSNQIVKVTNTTIPKIYEAIWGGENTVLLRYLKENDAIQTYSAIIPKSTTTEPRTLDGVFLAENISDIHFSPAFDKIFYLTPSGQGIVAKPNGQSKSEIYSSPTGEWLSEWPAEGTVSLTTKPTSNIAGHSYFLKTGNGSTSKILGSIAGLTTKTSPSAAYVFYTRNTGSMQSFLFDVKKQTSEPLTISTLSDKCVWNTASTALYCAVPKTIPPASYPDAWYQGRVHFSDSIWKITPSTATAAKIFDPEESNRASIDGINLMVSPKEDTLIFTNKNDSKLWSLNLAE